MTRVTIRHGNAITPYRVVATEEFHTDFAARLFGFMSCQDAQYTYWSAEEVQA